MTVEGWDPFFVPHPSLNHRHVTVRAHLLGFDASTEGPFIERRVSWMSLTTEERLVLERLLAKACRKR